jgi:hypothetical protein
LLEEQALLLWSAVRLLLVEQSISHWSLQKEKALQPRQMIAVEQKKRLPGVSLLLVQRAILHWLLEEPKEPR